MRNFNSDDPFIKKNCIIDFKATDWKPDKKSSLTKNKKDDGEMYYSVANLSKFEAGAFGSVGLSVLIIDDARTPTDADPDQGPTNNPVMFAVSICEAVVAEKEGENVIIMLDKNTLYLIL